MKTYKKNKSIFSISIFFIQFFCIIINAQERFLLSDKNMEDYTLISQGNTFWPVSIDSLNKNVIRQRWSISEKDEYYVNYCEFNSEEDAIKGTAYMANSCAMPFIFGSPTGEIIGDASWVSLDRSAICFQKGNIGIKIFKPVNFNQEDRNNILNLSNKVLVRIMENISPNIKTKEKELLKHQLSNADYQKTIEESNTLLTQDGYTEYKSENSKWIISEDSLVIGFRKQWSKDQSFFSIDMAILTDSIYAQKAIEYRCKFSVSPDCILNDYKSVSDAINEWIKKLDKKETLKYISIVGRIGNKSIHVYSYNNYGIDTDKIVTILKALN